MDEFKKLKEAREALNLTQSQLAGLMGDVPNAVSKLEAGQKKFVPKKYIQFFKSKGFDLNTLFDDELPLKRLSKEGDSVAEPGENYGQNDDVELLNRAVSVLGFNEKEHFARFIDHYNENAGPAFLIVLEAMKYWEKKYLNRFELMEQKMQMLLEYMVEQAAKGLDEESDSAKNAG